MTLATIISTDVEPLREDHSVQYALEYMKENAISSVVVIDDVHKPLGIFTEYDTLKIISRALDKKSPLRSIMSTNLFVLDEATELHNAYMYMQEKNYRHVIVIDEQGKYKGVASEGDFLRNMGFKDLDAISNIKNYISKVYLVVHKNEALSEVAKKMSSLKSDYAIVVENGVPQGQITQRDISHFCTIHTEVSNPLVKDIASSSMQMVKEEILIHDAVSLMESHGVHHLVVVDEQKQLLGVISRQNILKAIYGEHFDFLLKTIENKSANEQRLQALQEEFKNKTIFLRTVVDTLPDLVWLKDVDGKYLACNPMFEKFFGASEEEIVGKTDFDFVDAKLAQCFLEHDKKALMLGGSSENEEYLRFADGSYEGLFDTTKTPMRDTSGAIIGILGIAHDATQRREREKELEKVANYDLLTNLPNRNLFKTHLKKSLSNALRNEHSIALVIFDLDRFKDINDSYGHTVGDELLKQVAQRFLSRARQGDIVGRLGGDEFAIILEHIKDPSAAMTFTHELLDSLSAVYTLSQELQIHIGASAGIVIAPKDAQTVEELLQYADSALYKAKNEAIGSCRYYTDEMTFHAKEKISYENQLRSAIERNELEVYYQPQVHLGTGKIVGAEALLRWNHPTEGKISPEVFIPIAEESGLITSIGEWVLNQACKQAKLWLDMGHRLTMAVNVSANQVKFQDIPLMVENALALSGYDANRLELEITESALMQREEEIVKMLHTLRAKGIRLAIDDFGTGYSSLSYLKRFPIDVLKIDKSFIDDIPYEKDDMAIVIAIIEMGKALGYDVLAEGVEESAQMEFLKEKGCTMYQGYYKSQPLNAEQFLELLKRQ
ncbi:MAG: EAL domain-containing protein [Sulfurimonas sp.]|jgi:diguanylate cyclase (GGDEF)-like protein/PAS domain S-box-containing protein|nr:EAL domain-containing protein [Sulfurimonas sp.]